MNSLRDKRVYSLRDSSLLFVALVAFLLLFAVRSARTQTGGPPVPDLSAAKTSAALQLKSAAVPAALPKDAPEAIRSSAGALLSAGDRPGLLQAQAGAAKFYVLHTEFATSAQRAQLRVPGATVLTAFDRFVDLFIPPDKSGEGFDKQVVLQVISAPGFRWFDFPEAIELPPAPGLSQAPPTRAIPEKIVRGGTVGLTGKGVIIAVIDSGIDFRNRDFVTNDASGQPTSRLLYFWDTFSTQYDSSMPGSKPPYSFPNGQSIGTLYTQAQLTADLRSSAPRIPATDENGHGTAAAGVAAGNGNNRPNRGVLEDPFYTGVAPEADIIGVRIGGSAGAIENGYLLNAIVGWLDEVARREGKPVVLSCSFGGHHGGHDGQSVEERELDARFAASNPGRAIVIAAGNEQQDGLHSRLSFAGESQAATFAWQMKSTGLVSFYLHQQTGVVPDVKQIGAQLLAFTDASNQTSREPVVLRSYPNPLSGDLVVELVAFAGWSGVKLWSQAGSQILADGYVRNGAFHPKLRRDSEIVGTPGSTPAAITAGSYDWNDQFSYQGQPRTLKDTCGIAPMHLGDLSCYSSPGYDRNGTVKPDISAPGEWYFASNAHYPDGRSVGGEHTIPDTTGYYRLFNGTSAATPYTAGIVALMLQKKPTLTSSEIKTLLQRYATSDAYTGQVPNPRWGYGKLDYAAVQAILRNIH